MSAEDVWSALGTLVFERADPHGAVVAATGMSFFKCKLLRRLQRGPMTAGELTELVGSDPPYVSINLRELESRGLVSRTRDPDDRRRRLVELTDTGRATALLADTALATPPAEFSRLSDDDLATMRRILAVLLD